MIGDSSLTVQMESRIRDWEDRSDRRAIFLRCYSMMTQNMLAAIESGQFRDGAWVNRLLVHFADYYFKALEAYEESRPDAPLVWVRVHESARREETRGMQNLLLGVNAHINFDLVLTLVDMLGEEWPDLDEPARQLRYEDHCRVNEIIDRTIDSVQDQVIERLDPQMDLVDKWLGPLDEWVIGELIARWRDEVWNHAVRMLDTSDPEERDRQRAQIEARTQERASTILLEGGLANLAHFL